ncbi:hypothetical protein GCM10022224_047340 [Nonomuraea antimicrobica]|uniref:Uncharacterized protein n=1 Tax=Nonomuraea antimicrobica TaxID=561173 RepID=A0ABP7C4Y0_9ACTN
MGRGRVEQRPHEQDGLDPIERGAEDIGVGQVTDHRLHAGERVRRMPVETPDAHATRMETPDDLTPEVSRRTGHEYRRRTKGGFGHARRLGVKVDMKARSER